MFKVLLVDDEIFVRKGLQKLIKWEQLNLTVVGEAKNGGEALDLIERLNPDLVITDVMMPVLDGLELVRRVKETCRPAPVFIIISGYNEFKYAQQAIRYGVHEYLLKPIDANEMTTILQKLVNTIRKNKFKAFTNANYAFSFVLESILQENNQKPDPARYYEDLGMKQASGFLYTLAEIHAAFGEVEAGLWKAQELMSLQDACRNPILLVEQMPGYFGLLMDTQLWGRWDNQIQQALEAIRSAISGQLQQDITFYAGEPVDSIAQLRQSYLAANEALKHKHTEGTNCVVLYEQVKDKPLCDSVDDQGLYKQLLVQIEENNKEACWKLVDSLFQLFTDHNHSPKAVYASLSRFIGEVLEVAQRMNGHVESQQWLLEMPEGKFRSMSLHHLKEHFNTLVGDAAEFIARLRKEQLMGNVDRIKKYIDEHYQENINLKSIAAQFYMNPVYLGQLFRKTYGVYFNEYLLQLRVEEAKKLLRQTDMRMYEIAEKIGIRNANYFLSQFEKLEKISPMDYRNKLIGKE